MKSDRISAQGIGLALLMAAQTCHAFDTNSLARAIRDLSTSFPARYTRGGEFLKDLGTVKTESEFQALQRRALLANPLLDFDRILVIRRGTKHLGLPQNWQGDCALPRAGYTNDIAVLSISNGVTSRLFCPSNDVFVGDVDLDFDAEKMLFTMSSGQGRWHVFEMKADGSGLRRMTPDEPKVDQYDACYLPDGGIVFNSTAAFTGVPCVGGGTAVANLFRMNADGTGIRRLCFDQEHNWCPTLLEDGRVLYTRWEYTDTPHYFTRLLFTMNPDGTGQSAFYGSNSYWPNSIFFARPIPGEAGKVIGVISGHHGAPRMGELVLFDTARGRDEAAGVVQRFPGFGEKVEPAIKDQLVADSWPKFLHPFPLSGKYFLVPGKRPFYMGKYEVMNAQYRLFDPEHDSGYISKSNKDQTTRGIPVNRDRQPVVRVTWNEAKAFCKWVSKKTGRSFTLPSTDQWEWACRAGHGTPMWYGDEKPDFGKFANLADIQLTHLLVRDSPKWLPVIHSVDDGATVTTEVGSYQPNPWGLYDMHGNAAEWTSSVDPKGKKICRGGSFYDRPYRATATASRAYLPYQPVFDVGFRVIMTE